MIFIQLLFQSSQPIFETGSQISLFLQSSLVKAKKRANIFLSCRFLQNNFIDSITNGTFAKLSRLQML